MLTFDLIPQHLRLQCIQKFYFEDYRSFVPCSKSSCHISKALKSKLPLKANAYLEIRDNGFQITVEYLSIYGVCRRKCRVTEELVERIKNLPLRLEIDEILLVSVWTNSISLKILANLKNGWIIDKFSVYNYVETDLETFNAIIEQSKATIFAGKSERVGTEVAYLLQPAMQKLTKIEAFSPVSDLDLPLIKAPELTLTDTAITSIGINTILKQFVSGEREIVK